jgi:peptidoglycan/LPS O-acetylase OafA/YrhL
MLFAPIRRLPMLVAVAAVLGPCSRLLFGVLDGGPLRAGVLTVSCLDSLALGAMLALSPARLRRFALSAGLLLLAGVTASSLTGQGWLFRIACKDLAYALVAVWLVDRATRNRHDVAGRLLAFGPLRYLGTVSYGVYLYHDFLPPALRALGLAAWLPPSGFPKFLAVAGLSWIVAAVSWHFFEKPLNELKRFFPYVHRPSTVPMKAHAA